MAHFEFADPTRPVRVPAGASLEALARLAAQRALPVGWSLRLAAWRVRLGFVLGLSRRRCAKEVLRPLLRRPVDEGELESLTALARAIRRFGAHTYGPVYRRSVGWLARALRPEGLEHLEEARAAGRGAIVLGTHAGLNAWVGPVLSQLGYPLRLMQRRAVSAETLLLLRKDGLVSEVLPFPDNGEAGVHLKRLYDLLKAGVWIQHVADYPDWAKGIEGTCLGRKVCCTRAPWVLAALTGAALVPIVLLVEADLRLQLTVGKLIHVEGTGPDASRAAFQAYLDFVSRAVSPMPWNLSLSH